MTLLDRLILEIEQSNRPQAKQQAEKLKALLTTLLDYLPLIEEVIETSKDKRLRLMRHVLKGIKMTISVGELMETGEAEEKEAIQNLTTSLTSETSNEKSAER